MKGISTIAVLLALSAMAGSVVHAETPLEDQAEPSISLARNTVSLGRVPAGWSCTWPQASPDGRRVACVVKKGGKQAVFLDGKLGPSYDQVASFPGFSPDGARLAYDAGNGSKWTAVIDGKEGTPYDMVACPIAFSPDSKVVAYTATNRCVATWLDPRPKGATGFLVLNGEEQDLFHDVASEAYLSPDSTRVAYVGREDSKDFLVVIDDDGSRRGPSYDAIADIFFSPDSRHIAYIACKYDLYFNRYDYVVFDGKEFGPYSVEPPIDIYFSPDSSKLAFPIARPKRKKGEYSYTMMVNGKAGKAYDYIDPLSIVFSPDSKHMSYTAEKRGKLCVVLDGKASQGYEHGVSSVAFSPDSQHMAYVGRGEDSHVLVVDGKEVARHERIHFPIIPLLGSTFSPDSQRLAYWAKVNGEYTMVIDGVEYGAYEQWGWCPVFSPDSRHVAYNAKRDGTRVVVVDGYEEPLAFDDMLCKPLFDSATRFHFLALRQPGPEFYRVEIDIRADARAAPKLPDAAP